MNAYMAMRMRQQAEVEALPLRFAFGKKQYEEMMALWGLDPQRDIDKIAKLSICSGFYLKKDAALVNGTFERHAQELKSAIEADHTGEGFIKDMFSVELDDHEYSYTGDVTNAIYALGLSIEDVAMNDALNHGLRLAVDEIMEGKKA